MDLSEREKIAESLEAAYVSFHFKFVRPKHRVLSDENEFKESSENLLDEFDSAINEGLPTTTNGRDNLWTVAMIQALVDSTENGGGPISISDMMGKFGA